MGVRGTTFERWLMTFALAALAWCFLLLFGEKEFVAIHGMGHWHVADDSMIELRVAANFWRSGQPVFNIGEPVAANTSLFWPMIVAQIFRLVDHRTAPALLMVLSSLLTAATILVALACVRETAGKIFVALLLAATPGAFTYALTGWEHVPQALFVTAGFGWMLYVSDRDGRWRVPTTSVVLVALSFLFRMDSALPVALVWSAWFFTEGRSRRISTYVVSALLAVLPIAYLALMQHYYGSFVPNTAYLKVAGFSSWIAGLRYLVNPAQAGPAFYLVLALVALRAHLTAAERFLLVSAAAQMVYVVAVGGDVFENGRFFLLYLPILLVLVARVMARLPLAAPMATGLAVAALLLVALHVGPVARAGVKEALPFANGPNDDGEVSSQIRLAILINERLTPQDGSIGLHWLGIGYHMPDRHIVDFLGKAEPHIARLAPKSDFLGHNKFDYGYAFSTYRIAALPLEDSIHAAVAEKLRAGEDLRGVEEGADYYQIAALEAQRRGYVYLTPSQLGLAGAIGLYVRSDLAPRFTPTPSREARAAEPSKAR